MSFSLEKLPDEPIIIGTIAGVGALDETSSFVNQLTSLLDNEPGPLYFIIDMSQYSLSLEEMLTGTNQTTRGSMAFHNHPNLAGTIIISSSRMVKLAAKGMNTELFGNVHVKVFETMDDALAFARS